MKYEQFFADLTARLGTAERMERAFDRELARRFNVFDYVRTDETVLSRVIAALLDPENTHGQGTLFLRTFLDFVGLVDTGTWPNVDGGDVRIWVATEHRTHAGRNIDIVVQIEDTAGQVYGLAIENKPYAADQPNQIRDYLKYMKEVHGDRFLLIYLSPNAEGPSEESIATEALAEWKGHFAIMPYHGGSVTPPDHFDSFRIDRSLADWVAECRKNCEAERLRWFLRDFEAFCKGIGGELMTSSAESIAFSEFVLSNPANLKTAHTVYQYWGDVRDQISRRYLDTLCQCIERAIKERPDLKEFASDIQVDCQYKGSWSTRIWVCRTCWVPYGVAKTSRTYAPHEPYTAIRLDRPENTKTGVKRWSIGVMSPISVKEMTDEDQARRHRLEEHLEREFSTNLTNGHYAKNSADSDWWPLRVFVDEKNDKWDWDSHVPQLHRECDETGEITKYFVDRFIEVAERAMPVINEVEG